MTDVAVHPTLMGFIAFGNQGEWTSDRCFIFINIAEWTGDQGIPLCGSDKLDPEVLEHQLGYGGAGKGHSTRMKGLGRVLSTSHARSVPVAELQTQPAPLFPYGET